MQCTAARHIFSVLAARLCGCAGSLYRRSAGMHGPAWRMQTVADVRIIIGVQTGHMHATCMHVNRYKKREAVRNCFSLVAEAR